MRRLRKIICTALIITILVQLFNANFAGAAENPIQQAPQKLEVKPLHNTPPNDVQPQIGKNEFDGNYVDLQWDPIVSPPIAQNKYVNIYTQEIPKAYRSSQAIKLREKDISGALTKYRLKNLDSGTIYYISTKAYYSYTPANSTTTFTSPESESSNTVKVLTDIDIAASSFGTNQIKIVWDDVFNSGGRIDYLLYVSENKTFANTIPIRIGKGQIEPNGPVKVDTTGGKLEYIHSVRDPGRVYYIKIVPDIAEPVLKMTPETKTVAASSFILVKTTKMATNETGTIWRMDWSPVVTGISSPDIKVTYEVDKYINDVPIPMMLESGTNTFITIPPEEKDVYFIIRAHVTRNGLPYYPGIKIESDRVIVKDQEIPSVPPMPELVGEFRKAGDSNPDTNLIISYEKALTPTAATVLWRAPRKADGALETETEYDVWLISDPNLIDNPTGRPTTIKVSNSNYVTDDTMNPSDNVVGFKYNVSELMPNSTYYLKIVAKKSFLQFVDNQVQKVEYTSNPAIKIIITPTQGPIEQPVVPARPPLQIKKKTDGKEAIEKTEVTVQLKNKWFEKFNSTAGVWEYDEFYNPFANGAPALDNIAYRKIEYDTGVKIDVGCVKFTEGIDISAELANKVMGFPVDANDPDEDPTKNVPEQVNPTRIYKKHNVDIKLTDLEPNTTYIIWVRATRPSANVASGPSDPIIITTNPDVTPPVEKPVVPAINYTNVGDNYVDLGWDFKEDYTYNIKYGTTDDVNASTGSVTTTTTEMRDSGLSYLRIKGLTPNTQYYFWIQAVAKSGTQTSSSEWSDSYPLKTKPFTPPITPRGFGVKNGKDMITKNSVTFEWLKEDKMEYILEVSGGVDYKDAKEYKAGTASEFKVDNLRSNFRYFARLYAYDPEKQLRSEPTQSITVRTLQSSDDYDSNQDIENIISGDFIIKDTKVVNGTWTIRIVGVNADRLVEHMMSSKVLDYRIDATKPPAKTDKTMLQISSRVFDALKSLKENLIISTSQSTLIIRPDVLAGELAKIPVGRLNDFNYEISISANPAETDEAMQNLTPKTNIIGLGITAYDGMNNIPIISLNKALKVQIPYTDKNWYKEGVTSAYTLDNNTGKWLEQEVKNTFDSDNSKGLVTFETLSTGSMMLADKGTDYFDDIRGNRYENAIINLNKAYKLKSVKGRSFNPDNSATLGDTVKIMLDILGYSYGSDYMSVAAKAQLISNRDVYNQSALCTREKAIAMVVRIYELKTASEAKVGSSQSTFSDMGSVDPALRQKIMFAAENGMVETNENNTLNPDGAISRGEVAAILEKLLAVLGEID